MLLSTLELSRRSALVGGMVAAALLAWVPRAEARVTKIVIDARVSPAFDGQIFGKAGQYETIAGRAFGELDPKDPHNAIIQDITLAPRNVRGMVEYTASFQLVKPIDSSKTSRLLWHDVPNRAGRLTIAPSERALGDIGLSSGWQGDNSGQTVPGPRNEYLIVPAAKNQDGSAITGRVMGRILKPPGRTHSRCLFIRTRSLTGPSLSTPGQQR